MNKISAFYYYLECSVNYVQQRVWGRFYNEMLAYRIVNITMAVLWMVLMRLLTHYLHLNVGYAVVISATLVFPWAWYHSSNEYKNKRIEDKKYDFSRLPLAIRWFYIAYSTLMTIVAPLVIVVMLAWTIINPE